MEKLFTVIFMLLASTFAWSQWALPVNNGEMETSSGFTVAEFGGNGTTSNANYRFTGGQIFVRWEAREASRFDEASSGFVTGEGRNGSQAFKLANTNITVPNSNGWHIQFQTDEIDITEFGTGEYTFTYYVKSSAIPYHANNTSPAPLFPNVTELPSFSNATVVSRTWPSYQNLDSYQEMSITVNITDPSVESIKLAVQAGAEPLSYFFDDITLTRAGTNIVVWDGSAWSNSTGPTAADSTVIQDDLTISSDLAVGNLQIQSGTTTINSGSSLRVMDSASGNITVKRNTSANLGYSILGSPVTGADVATLAADFLYTWDGAAWTTPTGAMTPGMGYFVAYNSTSPQASVTGEIVSGNQTVSVTGSATSGHDGFNLLANPYTAAIALDDFLTANTNVSGVYFWDDAGTNAGGSREGDYYLVNTVGSVSSTIDLSGSGQGDKGTTGAESGFIGSLQGFFVNVTNDGNVNFTPSMQATSAGANADGNYYRQTAEQATLKFALSGKYHNEALIGFREDATYGIDTQFDAPKRFGNAHFAFYSLVDNEAYAIQVLPSLADEEELTLGYSLDEAGLYTLSIDDLEGIPSQYRIIATFGGKDFDLRAGDAQLNLPVGEGIIKVNLIASITNSSTSSQKMIIYKSGALLNAQMPATIDHGRVEILSVAGIKVSSFEDQSFENGLLSFQVNLHEGNMYILRVETRTGTYTNKFIY